MGKPKRTNIPCEKCGFNPLRSVGYQYKVRLKFTWKSGNVINSPGARNRYRYTTYKKQAAKVLSSLPLTIPKATGYRRLTLTRLYGLGPKGGQCYKYDRDNLAQGAKPIVDILKSLGIIIDDDEEHAEIHYRQEASPDKYNYIEILVEDLD